MWYASRAVCRLAFTQIYPESFHRGRCEPPLQLTPFRGGPVRRASPFSGSTLYAANLSFKST